MKKILLLFILIAFSTNIFSQTTTRQIITEGKSSVKLVPEELWFTVSLTARDSNYSKCADMAIEKINNIKKLFVKNGIDEKLIKANRYSIKKETRYDHKSRKSIFDGYKATIPITIRTKKEYEKNDKIFELIKNNLESNFNLNFSLSDKQTKAVKEELIKLAVEDAKQKSVIIAQSAGIKLGKIKNIQYGEPNLIKGNPQPDLRNSYKMVDLNTGAGSSITEALEPSEIEMQTNIIISWLIKDE